MRYHPLRLHYLPALFGVRRRRVTIVLPGWPIPYGRPYRHHPNGPVYMMTARKRVRPLPTQHLVVRHSVDYSLSDYITSDDSKRDSPLDSSSETPSDSSSYAISDSSSGHSSPVLLSRMRSSPQSPTTSVSLSSSVPEALSYVRVDLLPPPKRIRSSDSVTDLKVSSDESFESYVLRETSLRDDVDVEGSDEPYSEPNINPEIQKEINECIAYADALRVKEIDVRVVVETVA
nr:hypothetical protein [Tanacetum cinerariifolium]